jgi:teichuronic acid biosynthesis glycosyltransferase TuaC
MKVLHITNNYPTESHPIFGIFVKEQIESLTNIGEDNEVYFINGREKGVRAYIKGILEIRKKLYNADYDILHCHHIFSAFVLLLTFRFFKYKRIVSYQNPPSKEGGNFLYRIVKLFFHGIIIKSISQVIDKQNIFYLPNGVNTEFFKPYSKVKSHEKLGLDSNIKYILFMDSYVGRTQKRVDRFNDVINILKLKKSELNIEPLILTNTERSLIPYYMNISALHLLTSDFEGSPNSVKECLCCNTPIVTTPVGNVHDMIGDIDGCYISNSFEPSELAELVLKSLTNKKFSGRQKLLEKALDIESVANRLQNIYKKIVHD